MKIILIISLSGTDFFGPKKSRKKLKKDVYIGKGRPYIPPSAAETRWEAKGSYGPLFFDIDDFGKRNAGGGMLRETR